MTELTYIDQIHDVMTRSGQRIMRSFQSDASALVKADGTIVTQVDVENEQFLQMELRQIIPGSGFFGEESGLSQSNADFIWIIDPLDGTRNFVKGLPHFCMMLALAYKHELIMSAIYLPVSEELYYAESGKGVWYNRLQKMEFANRLKHDRIGLVACGQQDWRLVQLQAERMNINVSRRHFGSVGIDIVCLLQGQLDAVIYKNMHWWDIAPGILCIAELGGLLYEYQQNSAYGKVLYFKAGNRLLIAPAHV